MDLAALAARLERVSVGYAGRERFERFERDDDWFLLKLVEELGELVQIQLLRTGRSKDRGVPEAALDGRLADECADVLGHVLLLAHRHGVDLDSALQRKWLRREHGGAAPSSVRGHVAGGAG